MRSLSPGRPRYRKRGNTISSQLGRSCRVALAARTVIGQAGLVALDSNSNRRPAARTWAAATAVDRVALAHHRRHEVGSHQVAGGKVKLAKPRVIELGGRHPG